MEQIINDYQATEWPFESHQENENISNLIGMGAQINNEMQTNLEEMSYYQETERHLTAHNGRYTMSNLTEGCPSAQWSVGSTPADAEIRANIGEFGNDHQMESFSEYHNETLTEGSPSLLQPMASTSTDNQSFFQNRTELISATEQSISMGMQKEMEPFCVTSIQQNTTFKFSSRAPFFEQQSEYSRDVSSVFQPEPQRLNSSLRLLLPEGGNINCTEKDSSNSQSVRFEELTDDNLTSISFGNLCASAGPSSGWDLIEQCEPMGLDAHRHAEDRRIVCPFCERIVHNSFAFDIHFRTHTGEKPYECDICDKRFNTPSELTKHRRIHTRDLPYACDECGHKSNTKQDLARHRIIHTDERPFECPICGKAFNDLSNCKRHIKGVHHKK